jgi:hypothetical protein
MSIRASASIQDITPRELLPLAGYHESPRQAAGVQDQLLASAIHLRGGEGGVILISLDLLTLDPSSVERIRQGVVDATGTLVNNVFIGTTQTHSAPVTSNFPYWYGNRAYGKPNPEYLDLVVSKAVEAAGEAAVSSKPASIAVMEFEHPHTGAILIRGDTSNRIIAVLLVHNDVPDYLGTENNKISPDFLNAARQQIAKRFGETTAVIFFPAPSADRKIAKSTDETKRGKADDAGKELAELIVSKTASMSQSDFTSKISLSGKITQIDLEAREQIISPPGAENEIFKIKEEFYSTRVQTICIGEMILVGVPGYITTDCAKHIAGFAKNRKILISECVSGDLQGGIITPSENAGGQFHLASPIFKPENGEKIMDIITKLVG